MWQELGKREEFFEWEIIRGFFFGGGMLHMPTRVV